MAQVVRHHINKEKHPMLGDMRGQDISHGLGTSAFVTFTHPFCFNLHLR